MNQNGQDFFVIAGTLMVFAIMGISFAFFAPIFVNFDAMDGVEGTTGTLGLETEEQYENMEISAREISKGITTTLNVDAVLEPIGTVILIIVFIVIIAVVAKFAIAFGRTSQ